MCIGTRFHCACTRTTPFTAVQRLWKGSHYYMYAFSARLNVYILALAFRYPGPYGCPLQFNTLQNFIGAIRRCWSERRDCGGTRPDLDVWRARREVSFKASVGIAAIQIEYVHCCERKVWPREPARELLSRGWEYNYCAVSDLASVSLRARIVRAAAYR